VVERGSVESADVIDIVSKVKAQATVKWVVEDGTAVKTGERGIVLDDSALREELAAQKIALDQAQAGKLAAEPELKLARKETEVAVLSAELRIKVAKLELKNDDGKNAERQKILEQQVELAERSLDAAKQRGRATELKAEADFKAKAVALELEAKRRSDLEA